MGKIPVKNRLKKFAFLKTTRAFVLKSSSPDGEPFCLVHHAVDQQHIFICIKVVHQFEILDEIVFSVNAINALRQGSADHIIVSVFHLVGRRVVCEYFHDGSPLLINR